MQFIIFDKVCGIKRLLWIVEFLLEVVQWKKYAYKSNLRKTIFHFILSCNTCPMILFFNDKMFSSKN